jgi:hypothetical protein
VVNWKPILSRPDGLGPERKVLIERIYLSSLFKSGIYGSWLMFNNIWNGLVKKKSYKKPEIKKCGTLTNSATTKAATSISK